MTTRLEAQETPGNPSSPGRSLAEIWDEIGPFLGPLVRSQLASWEAAGRSGDDDESVQEVALHILSNLRAGKHDPASGPLLAWVKAVSHNFLVNRSLECKRQESQHPDPSAEDAILSNEPGPALVYETRRIQRWVREALAGLENEVSSEDYELFLLRRIEECPVGEVAERLDTTRDHVRSRVCRLQEKLRLILEALREGEYSGVDEDLPRNS